MMEETGAEVIEMRRTEDGLGFHIKGGRDSEYVQFRLIHQTKLVRTGFNRTILINQSKGR